MVCMTRQEIRREHGGKECITESIEDFPHPHRGGLKKREKVKTFVVSIVTIEIPAVGFYWRLR